MPIARFQMPDGRVARFEVPEGTSPEQAQTLMQSHFQQPTAAAPEAAPANERSVGGFAGNVVKSAGAMLGGVGHAIAHPIDTVTGVADLAVGGALNAAPKEVLDWFNKHGDPEKVKKITSMANAVGGQYAKDYGTIEGLKEKLYADPVGVMADLSTVLTGGGGLLSKAGKVAGKADAAVLAGLLQGEGSTAARVAGAVAPTAGKVARAGQIAEDVGAALTTAGKYTNPMAPVIAGIDKSLPVAANAMGAVRDYFDPRIKAANITRQAAGQNLDAIRAANAAAPADLTAAQAAAGEVAPTYQALAAGVAQQDIDRSLKVAQAQEAARKATVQNVTPDLAAAEETLKAGSGVAYDRARMAETQRINNLAMQQQHANMMSGVAGPYPVERVSPALEALKGNPVIDAAAKEARTLAKTKGVTLADPMSTLDGLHYMKIAIDNQFKNRGATTALNNYSDAALTATKESLLAAIEGTANQPGVSPLYGLARKQHAELSGPVNQAKILNAMQETLTGEAGGERANAFLNAMGKGENALIKRADQSPRFGGLEDVLTEKQMAAANKVAGELKRDIKIADEASKGKVALAEILANNKSNIRIPFLNTIATAANKTISILEGKVDAKTINILKEAFRSGKNVNELLDTLPAKDRVKFLADLGKAQSGLSPAKLTALGVTSNALAPTRIELNNMAPSRP